MTMLKNMIADLAQRTNTIKLLGRILRKNSEQSAILMYHRVGNNVDAAFPKLETELFYQQMSWLHNNADVVPLSSLVQKLELGHDIAGQVVLTFDDGYVDFFTHVFPILRTLQLPATVFAAIEFLDGSIPWYDQIRYVVYHTKLNSVDLRLNGSVMSLSLTNNAERNHSYNLLKRLLGCAANGLRCRRLSSLCEQFHLTDLSPLSGSTMTWEQLKVVQQSGIEIGGHSYSHPFLINLDDKTLYREVMQPKLILEERLQVKIDNFCYPAGRYTDYDLKTKAFIRQSGFHSACSTEHGYVQKNDDPFALKRLFTTEEYLAKFAWRLP